jgi:hypothetical protein
VADVSRGLHHNGVILLRSGQVHSRTDWFGLLGGLGVAPLDPSEVDVAHATPARVRRIAVSSAGLQKVPSDPDDIVKRNRVSMSDETASISSNNQNGFAAIVQGAG